MEILLHPPFHLFVATALGLLILAALGLLQLFGRRPPAPLFWAPSQAVLGLGLLTALTRLIRVGAALLETEDRSSLVQRSDLAHAAAMQPLAAIADSALLAAGLSLVAGLAAALGPVLRRLPGARSRLGHAALAATLGLASALALGVAAWQPGRIYPSPGSFPLILLLGGLLVAALIRRDPGTDPAASALQAEARLAVVGSMASLLLLLGLAHAARGELIQHDALAHSSVQTVATLFSHGFTEARGGVAVGILGAQVAALLGLLALLPAIRPLARAGALVGLGLSALALIANLSLGLVAAGGIHLICEGTLEATYGSVAIPARLPQADLELGEAVTGPPVQLMRDRLTDPRTGEPPDLAGSGPIGLFVDGQSPASSLAAAPLGEAPRLLQLILNHGVYSPSQEVRLGRGLDRTRDGFPLQWLRPEDLLQILPAHTPHEIPHPVSALVAELHPGGINLHAWTTLQPTRATDPIAAIQGALDADPTVSEILFVPHATTTVDELVQLCAVARTARKRGAPELRCFLTAALPLGWRRALSPLGSDALDDGESDGTPRWEEAIGAGDPQQAAHWIDAGLDDAARCLGRMGARGQHVAMVRLLTDQGGTPASLWLRLDHDWPAPEQTCLFDALKALPPLPPETARGILVSRYFRASP